ncbi:hypothetical protein [Roseovarius pelagicus]|uniref:Uncharacterized protein n=1 Tax=Roseovarius pelagicus TaxID=2980108 RepID=A0ABY6DFE3_9RHOB|nr:MULTISPECIES: hypothetical protein [Rhodobacterales]UXX84871.1 hypothetical protein N7U68_09620 [Roseovarius pelagicus]
MKLRKFLIVLAASLALPMAFVPTLALSYDFSSLTPVLTYPTPTTPDTPTRGAVDIDG